MQAEADLREAETQEKRYSGPERQAGKSITISRQIREQTDRLRVTTTVTGQQTKGLAIKEQTDV